MRNQFRRVQKPSDSIHTPDIGNLVGVGNYSCSTSGHSKAGKSRRAVHGTLNMDMGINESWNNYFVSQIPFFDTAICTHRTDGSNSTCPYCHVT